MALTASDRKWVKDVLESALVSQEQKFEAKIDSALDNQEQKFEAKIVEIKNDFYEKIDPVLKEVMASREERELLSHRVSNHEDRLEKVEKKLDLHPAI